MFTQYQQQPGPATLKNKPFNKSSALPRNGRSLCNYSTVCIRQYYTTWTAAAWGYRDDHLLLVVHASQSHGSQIQMSLQLCRGGRSAARKFAESSRNLFAGHLANVSERQGSPTVSRFATSSTPDRSILLKSSRTRGSPTQKRRTPTPARDPLLLTWWFER